MNIQFKIPKGFNNANDFLRHTAFEGITRRYSKEKIICGVTYSECDMGDTERAVKNYQQITKMA